jgi:hypothetical protein
LVTTVCKHSGDIRSIPNKIVTAEYININIDELARAKAKFVTFTCNAYSNGSITPNIVVGWMNSKHPMKISEKNRYFIRSLLCRPSGPCYPKGGKRVGFWGFRYSQKRNYLVRDKIKLFFFIESNPKFYFY